MSGTAPIRRSLRASIVIALVLALGATFTVARAAKKPIPYSNRCTVVAPDTDGDRLPDCWERKNGLDPARADADSDRDNDGLTALGEYVVDMRAGGRPLFPYRASSLDSNGNGKPDGNEDLDGDGYSNKWELAHGTDPLDPNDPAPNGPPPGPSPTPSGPPSPGPSPAPTTTPPPQPSPTPPPPPPPSPTPPPGPACTAVPSSIASDGSRDVTSELQAFIDSAPDGSCIRFPSGARYRADDTIWFRNRNDLTISATGATLFTDALDPIITSGKGAGGSDRRQIVIEGGSNITIEGLTIDGPNPNPVYLAEREFEAGIAVRGTQGATLRNLTIREVYGDFVTITDWSPVPNSGELVPARDVLVTGGNFDVAGRQGVALTGDSVNTTIDNNTFTRIARSGVDIELIPGRLVRDARITNNVFDGFGLNWVAMGGRSSVSGVYFGYNRIVGDTLRLKIGPPAGVTGVSHEYLTFEGNSSDTLAEGSSAIFSFRYVNYVVIVDNVQRFEPNAAGIVIWADGGCDYTVEGNDFAGMVTLFAQSRPPACAA